MVAAVRKHDITAALRSGSDVKESGRRWVGHTTNTTATVSQEMFCSFVLLTPVPTPPAGARTVRAERGVPVSSTWGLVNLSLHLLVPRPPCQFLAAAKPSGSGAGAAPEEDQVD